MARFALYSNGQKIETLESLKNNFIVKDMLDNFKNKRLFRFLVEIREMDLLEKLNNLSTTSDDNELTENLIDLFGISGDQKEKLLHQIQVKKDQIESAQGYLDSIKRFDEIVQRIKNGSSSPEELDALILSNVSVSKFTKAFKDLFDKETVFEKIKLLSKTHASAMVKLGGLYQFGLHVSQNDDIAFSLYSQAAELGDSYGMNSLANCFLRGKGCTKDISKNVEWLKKAADMLNPISMSNLGNCYNWGNGVAQSYTEALHLYKQSADMGCSMAKNNLGGLYEQGKGVEKNLLKAFSLYQEAAVQEPLAQRNLGRCYEFGYGVEINMEQAYFWYLKAAEAGDSIAQKTVGNFLEFGKGNVEKNEAQAVEWYEKSAAQNNTSALSSLGFCYLQGVGVEKNSKIAAELFKKSSDLGCIYATRDLGYCYQNGDGVEKNLDIALKLYKDAAEQGDTLAMRWTGDLYNTDIDNLYDFSDEFLNDFLDENHEIDLKRIKKEANKWYKRAAEQGDAEAMVKYFKSTFSSGGNEAGFLPAFNFLKKAYELGNPKAKAWVGQLAIHQAELSNEDSNSAFNEFANAVKNMCTTISPDDGFKLILEAVSENDDDAIFFLGLEYLEEDSKFCDHDPEYGKTLLTKAANMGNSEAKDELKRYNS